MPLIDLPDRLPDRFDDGNRDLYNRADLAGLITVINDIFDNREPERFGSDNQRKALHAFVKTIPHDFVDTRFWIVLGDEIENLGIGNPFEGISIAAVGCSAPNPHSYEAESTLLNAFRLTYGHCHFDNLYQFDGSNEVSRLNTSTSTRYLQGKHPLQKVDYLITGNVLNAWETVRDDTLLGCANMVKQGGKIIHMLNYGDGRGNDSVVEDETLQAYAGQRHIRNVPEGKFCSYGGETGTHIMILEQEHEVAHTPETLQAFRDAKASGKPITRFSAADAQINPASDRTVVRTGNGK